MIPRVGEPVIAGMRYRPRPGAYAILMRRGQVLLTHQSRPEPEFQLPGGGIDKGEQVIPALHREVFEETGWRVSGLKRLGAYRRFSYMPEYDLWAEKVCHVFIGRPTFALSGPTEPHHEAVWANIPTAVELLAGDGDRLFLSDFL